MATTNLGRVRFNMRGDYNPDADPLYSLLDLVSDGGGSFVYINDTPSNEPTSSTSHWQQIASVGGQDLVDAAVVARDAAQGYKDAAAASATQLAAGVASPAGTYADYAALVADDPDNSKIYVVTADGHWYYWSGAAWADGGVYQAVSYPALEELKQQLLVPLDLKDEFLFEIGGLNSNGTESVISTRIRTDGYYAVGDKDIVVSVTDGTIANFSVRMYDSSYVLQGLVEAVWMTEPLTIPKNYYMRVTMRYADDAAIPSISALSQYISITEYVFGLSIEDIVKPDGSLNGSVLLDESVTPSKTSFLKTTVKTVSQVPDIGFNQKTAPTATAFTEGFLSFAVVVEPYERVTFTLENCDRYILGIFDGIPTSVGAYMQLDEAYTFEYSNTYTYQNSDGIRKYALVNGKSSSGSESATVTAVTENYIEMNDYYFASVALASGAIDGEALVEESVPPSKLSFIGLLDKTMIPYVGYGGNNSYTPSTEIILTISNACSYVTTIEPNETVEIVPENNDRFQVGLFDNPLTIIKPGAIFDEMYITTGSSSYTYTNTDTFRKLMFVYLKSSVNESEVTCTVHSKSGYEFVNGYYLKTENELDSSGSVPFEIGENTTEIYPVMTAVKMSNEWDFTTTHPPHPRPIGWLYYDPTNYKFYYSMGKPDNLKYLFTWNASVSEGKLPPQYRAFITKHNDIIFVWRGDINTSNPRRNPIVYPSGEYNSPVLIDFGEGLKPTSWLQSCGADYLYNQNVFMFAEYTRPVHVPNANIWRVTEPVTDVLNWSVVHSIALSGDPNIGFKHYHILNYDPYSGMCYASSGDDDTAAKIYASSDYGLNWTTVLEGNRQARACNLCFTQEKVYWANDDYTHGIYSIDRGIGNVPDFTNITTVSSLAGQPPTYANILIDDPYGILILNRNDVYNNGVLDVLFWSFDDGALYTLATLAPVNKTLIEGEYSSYGFRHEAVNFYHSRGDNLIVMGFNNPLNGLDIMSNDIADGLNSAINTITMKVYRTATGYGIEFGTIMMSE